MDRKHRTIKYYAIHGKMKQGYPQLLITVKNTKLVSTEYTGIYYKTLNEANRDLFRLNCAGKIVG